MELLYTSLAKTFLRFLLPLIVSSCAVLGLDFDGRYLGLNETELLVEVGDLTAAPLPLTLSGKDVSYFKKNANGSSTIYYLMDGKVAALQSIESNINNEQDATERRISNYVELLNRRGGFDGETKVVRSRDLELFESTALKWIDSGRNQRYLLISNTFETAVVLYNPNQINIFDVIRNPDQKGEIAENFKAFKDGIKDQINLETEALKSDFRDYLNDRDQAPNSSIDTNDLAADTSQLLKTDTVETQSNPVAIDKVETSRGNYGEGIPFGYVLIVFVVVSILSIIIAFLMNKKLLLLVLPLIFICGYILHFYYFSPTKVLIKEVNQPYVHISKNLPLVSSLGIKLSGHIDGAAIVRFSGAPNERGLVFELEEGSIDLYQGSDWYADSCFIFYEPKDAKSGEILIEYTLGTPFN